MNKKLILVFILIFVGCSPQVTVTSEVTVTLPPPTKVPVPTLTLHPDFIALQNLISDSSNLVLLPDGTIEDNGLVIPNLHVDQNGVINLIITNENVVIEQSQISFNDGNSISVNGYELDENGEWVAAGERAVINGVSFELSDEVDANGFSVVTSWEIDNQSLSEEKQTELLKPFNIITDLGLADDVYLLCNAETQELRVVKADDHTKFVGEWKYGEGEIVWQGDILVPLLFGEGSAKLTLMNGVNVVDRMQARIDALKLEDFISKDKSVKNKGYYSRAIFLYNGLSESEAIIAFLSSKDETMNPEIAASGEVDGVIYFLSDTGENIRVRVSNLTHTIRYTRTFDQ